MLCFDGKPWRDGYHDKITVEETSNLRLTMSQIFLIIKNNSVNIV